jgi:hypothetical protein
MDDIIGSAKDHGGDTSRVEHQKSFLLSGRCNPSNVELGRS